MATKDHDVRFCSDFVFYWRDFLQEVQKNNRFSDISIQLINSVISMRISEFSEFCDQHHASQADTQIGATAQ